MTDTQLVTGGTGFVGSALVLELLRATEDRILCLVRPGERGSDPQQRLERVLGHVARAFDQPELVQAVHQRCRAVAGDLRLDRCGLGSARLGRVSQLWHGAASLRFEPEHRSEIFNQNVGGTRRALQLGAELGARGFNYVSTAYVAGVRTGRIPEALHGPDAPASNLYEESKQRAERLVAASGLEYRILRPSIVIGHSKTAAVINPSGLYQFARRLAGLRKLMERRGEADRIAKLELQGDPEAPLNLIPVDVVAQVAVRIASSPSRARIFHLTNAEPPSIGQVGEELNALVGLRGARYVRDPAPDAPYREFLGRQMRFFVSYMTLRREFDVSNSAAVAGSEALRWPLRGEGIRRHLRWYLENAR